MNKQDILYIHQYDFFNRLLTNESEKPYPLWYLLDLIDEATSWDQEVLEELYTAEDVLLSLAQEMDIDSINYENLDLLFEAVEDKLNKAGQEPETEFGFSF